MYFAKVEQGPRQGEMVPVLDINPAINLISEDDAPRNPYALGYGPKIPTCHKVRIFDNRWRRVYVAQYGNAGTAYVIYRGQNYRVSW